MSNNDKVAQAVALAVVWLAVYETLILSGVVTGHLPAGVTLLQALASVIASLQEE